MPQPHFELGTDFGTDLRLAFACCGTENGGNAQKADFAKFSMKETKGLSLICFLY
jgi:hypothetical protein